MFSNTNDKNQTNIICHLAILIIPLCASMGDERIVIIDKTWQEEVKIQTLLATMVNEMRQ